MLERAKIRALPIAARAESAPMVATCCNACRTCVSTNLIGIATAGLTAAGVGVAGFARRFVTSR